ncbi:Exocyst complex component EXO70H1 [Linum perenne]
MQKAMGRLEKEFHLILRSNREQLDAELVSVRDSFVVASSRSYNRTLMLVDLEDGEVTDGDDIPTRETEISEVDGDLIIVISDLKSIADCMIGDAYTKECVKIYQIIRKSIIDEGLYRLGVHIFSFAVDPQS